MIWVVAMATFKTSQINSTAILVCIERLVKYCLIDINVYVLTQSLFHFVRIDALTLKLNEFRESLLALELVVPGFESAIKTTMYIIQNVEERSPPNILEVDLPIS